MGPKSRGRILDLSQIVLGCPSGGLGGVPEHSLEAIAERIRSHSVWEAESNIEFLDLASILAAADWDASFTMERVNFLGDIAKAFRRKCEFD
jgi:hypothetical protein